MTLRCKLLGHRWELGKDYTKCPPGRYMPIRWCVRCDNTEELDVGCVRDDARWAAIKVEQHHGPDDPLPPDD